MAEVLLSAFLRVLFDRLSRELLDFVLREGLEDKLNTWRKTLEEIEALLDDEDEKQHMERLAKKQLDDLRDFAYDLEDILDEFVTEASRRRLTGGDQASTSRVRKLIPACCTAFTPSAVWIDMGLRSEIEEITARFERMVTRKDNLKKLSGNVGRRTYRKTRREILTSVVTKANIYGRDKEKTDLLRFLVDEKHSNAQLSVMPIIGMGGVGKTTLAQLVYEDEQIQKSFDLKAWAWVSDDFDAAKVTNAVLKCFYASSDENDLNLLQVKLKEILKGKKFLVVLDDLWNNFYLDWTTLRTPFEEGAPGSMIIITTRNREVALTIGTFEPYRLTELPKDHCLSILAHHALNTRDFHQHPNLKDIGEEIVGRCKGSPLAAKVLGGVLKSNLDPDEWKKVLKSKIWDLPGVGSEIAQALMLSYHHLPSNLKRCFAYCSILPKDYEFEEQQMILLWMAEGFIQPEEGEGQMEDLGGQYFRNLLSRSLFQMSSTKKSRYVMHNLIHDLAQQVSEDIWGKMEVRAGGSNITNPSRKARHLSYLGDLYDSIQKFESFCDLTCLRTFLPLMHPLPGERYLTSNVLPKLLPQLRRIRVLSLSRYDISEVPQSIGDLKHLRFLDMSHTKIRGLPESTTNLYNLQTLILEHCLFLKKLPSKFGKLVNLRHLNILGANELEGMPLQISKLTCLQSLSNLIVSSSSEIKELGPLLQLRETLCISGLENVINPQDARDARLFEKHNLYGLSLEWSGNLDDSQDRTSELEVLNMLQPHEGLKELIVKHYGGAEFSTWLGVRSFSNMVLLRIECCEKCTLLPPVGQLQSLRELFIEGMASVKNIGREFNGERCSQPFKSLETLHFKNMQEWKNWIPCEEFLNLRELSITRCPKLVSKLPNHLPSLENIVIRECKQLVSIYCFPKHCMLEIEGSKEVVVHSGKVDFSSLHISSLSTISEFIGQNEGFILEGLTTVKDLTIASCEELTTLWSNNVGLLQHFPCLDVLKISNCTKLVSLAAKEVEEQLQLDLPFKLREIEIRNCEVLESLSKAVMYNSSYLEDVYICHCTSLTNVAIGQLPPTLKWLKIEDCNMLILVDGDDINNCGNNTSFLEYLEIRDCPLLKSLTSSGELPATLKHLQITNCEKLESIAKSFHHNSFLEVIRILYCENLKSLPIGIHSLNHLDEIYIQRCPTLVSFPDRGLLPANLRSLTILECKKMQALPNCIHNLTSLQQLQIGNFPSIVSFPEVGFPTNLTSLSIHDLVSFNEAFCDMLTSLKKLEIHGGSSQLVSFPEMMLPSSLTTLSIHSFPNLKYLSSKGFEFLTSLEELLIEGCKNLMSFPKDGLPPSLLQLHIICCPLLKERCKIDQEQEWSKIAPIPCVQIDRRFIYDPEEESQ